MHVSDSEPFMRLLAERIFASPPRVLHPEELMRAIDAERAPEQGAAPPGDAPPGVDVRV